jgi:type III secretory pathway component EscV
MNKQLKELYKNNIKKITVQHVIEIMKTIQKCKISIKNTGVETSKITSLSEKQKMIQDLVLSKK